jgi:hypothetical protein
MKLVSILRGEISPGFTMVVVINYCPLFGIQQSEFNNRALSFDCLLKLKVYPKCACFNHPLWAVAAQIRRFDNPIIRTCARQPSLPAARRTGTLIQSMQPASRMGTDIDMENFAGGPRPSATLIP